MRPPLAHSLSEITRKATAAREDAAETRLAIWCERLARREAIIEVAVEAAISIMSADQGNIQLVEDNTLVIKAQRGFTNRFLDYFQVVSDGRTACRAAWKQTRLIHVPDVSSSPIYSRRALEAILDDGIRAVASVPMLTDTGQTLGVLSVHYRRPHRPRATDLSRFQRLQIHRECSRRGVASPLTVTIYRSLPS